MAKDDLLTITDIIARCIENGYLERASTTARAYRNGIHAFERCLIDHHQPPTLPVEKLTVGRFIEFPAWLLKNGYSKKTVNTYLSGARYFLKWLVINGFLEPTYAETIRLKAAMQTASAKREYRLPRTPSKGIVEQMIEAVQVINEPTPRRERDISLILFLATSGCRNEEATRLVVKDIDLAERSAVVTGKGSKQRKAFFSQETADALRLYWSVRGSAEKANPAFARHDKGAGKKILPISTTTVREIVHQVAQVAGVEYFIPHQFRHGFAVTMLRETGNLALVQDLLGHASPNVTREYAKIFPEELRDAHREVFK